MPCDKGDGGAANGGNAAKNAHAEKSFGDLMWLRRREPTVAASFPRPAIGPTAADTGVPQLGSPTCRSVVAD